MMKKTALCLLIASGCLTVMSSAALGATWTLVGTSPHTVGTITPNPGETVAETYMTDANRTRTSGLVVDAAGNVYTITNDWENIAGTPDRNGGVTIFTAAGGVIGVNLRALGYPGALTKLAVAGDGKVYALQNWVEINWPGGSRSWDHKILRINPSGSVDLILNATDWSPSGTHNRDIDMISGMTVGEGGHIFFIMRTPNGGYYETHMLWRYRVDTGAIDPAPRDPIVDEGWGASCPALYSIEYVGNGWYAIFYGGTGSGRGVDAIRWDQSRHIPLNGTGADGFSEQLTAIGYDPLRTILWAAQRGQTSGLDKTAIAWRLSGTPSNGSLFTTYDSVQDKVLGIDSTKTTTWHLNRNDPAATGVKNWGKYWCQAFAINPADGKAWMAWAGDRYDADGINYVGNFGVPTPPVHPEFSAVGTVFTADTDAGVTYASEGAPQANNYVMALGFGKRAGSCYAFALALDRATAAYRLYRTDAIACPPEGACCGAGNSCQVMSANNCAAAGGVYSGDNTSCNPNICKVVGACCQKGNVCTPELATACATKGGVFQGVDTDHELEEMCDYADCRWEVCQTPVSDTDGDGDVDMIDFAVFQRCLTGDSGSTPTDPPCSCLDVAPLDAEGKTDGKITAKDDFAPFLQCGSGSGVPFAPGCY